MLTLRSSANGACRYRSSAGRGMRRDCYLGWVQWSCSLLMDGGNGLAPERARVMRMGPGRLCARVAQVAVPGPIAHHRSARAELAAPHGARRAARREGRGGDPEVLAGPGAESLRGFAGLPAADPAVDGRGAARTSALVRPTSCLDRVGSVCRSGRCGLRRSSKGWAKSCRAADRAMRQLHHL